MTTPPGSGAFGAILGMTLAAEHADGSVDVALDAGVTHAREGGIVHGGVMMTMLDSAMAAAVRRTLAEGQWIASVTIHVDFLKAARPGPLTARGLVERKGKTLAFARGELRDASGEMVARGSGIWAIR